MKIVVAVESCIEKRVEREPLVRALVEFLTQTTALVQSHTLIAAHDLEVKLVIGGNKFAEFWGVGPDAVGFQAIAGPIDFDPVTKENVLNVADLHLAAVNIDGILDSICSSWDLDDDLRHCDLESIAVTIPHELFHVIQWAGLTGGKTPLQVYDEGGGMDAVAAVSKLQKEDEGLEDDAEAFGALVINELGSAIPVGVLAAAFDGHLRLRNETAALQSFQGI